MTPPASHRRLARLALLAICVFSRVAGAQGARDLPFGPGERFEYAGRVHVGVSGKGSLWIEGPTELRGTTTWLLHSDMQGSFGFLKASDNNASWLDPERMTALRYTSREHHLLKRHDDAVDIFAGEKRWVSESGAEGQLSNDAPLDELSFLYYLRTLPLSADTTLTLNRHFDVARNPTTIKVVGREDIDVGAGRFHALIVEMRVRDTRRYNGEGVIRVSFSDDKCRLVLRLESDLPDAGKASLALVSYSGTRCDCTAQIK